MAKSNGKKQAPVETAEYPSKKKIVREAVTNLGPEAPTAEVRRELKRLYPGFPGLDEWVKSNGFSAGLSEVRKELRGGNGKQMVIVDLHVEDVPDYVDAIARAAVVQTAEPEPPKAPEVVPTMKELLLVKHVAASAFGGIAPMDAAVTEIDKLAQEIGWAKLATSIAFWKENG